MLNHVGRVSIVGRMRIDCRPLTACLAAVILFGADARGQKQVFSGPQVGEKTTAFKVIDVIGESKGKEWDVIGQYQGKPSTIVFVHGLERSIVPLLSVIDQYGHEKKDALSTIVVFLSNDRVESEKRLPLVAQSLRFQVPIALSVDGAEGPGNYGLNKECLMTIAVARENKVTANFALVQPGIADAPAVIAAMAQACGDAKPPNAEALLARKRGPAAREREMARGDARAARPAAEGAKPDLPGAAPTDERLIRLLRSFINKENDPGTVDRLVKEVQEYVKESPDLTRQAIGGWTRVIHLKYGTEYAQKAGQAMVDGLKKQ